MGVVSVCVLSMFLSVVRWSSCPAFLFGSPHYMAEKGLCEPMAVGAKKRLAEDSRRHRGAMEGICPSEIAQPFGGGDGLTVRTTVTKVKGPDLRFDSQQRHPIFGSLQEGESSLCLF